MNYYSDSQLKSGISNSRPKFRQVLEQTLGKDLKDDLAIITENITRASEPGYREKLKGPEGNLIRSNEPGLLKKTNWSLDFAVFGNPEDRGIKLQNGKYTRDGRFVFDSKSGQLVSLKEKIPLKIKFNDTQKKKNLSNRELEVNQEGILKDKTSGEILGKIEFEGKKILQGYLEVPKINVAQKIIELRRVVKELGLLREIPSLEYRFRSQAIGILNSL